MSRQIIKIGTKCDTKFGIAKVTGIELCRNFGDKDGIPQKKIYIEDKDRCVFDFDNGHWQYGYQVSV